MIPETPKSSPRAPEGVAPARRVHVASLGSAQAGALVNLEAREAHHLLHVRRMANGETVELFDDEGRLARGALEASASGLAVRIWADPQGPTPAYAGRIVVYSALPKGSRADWMVEKLSELGVAELVPLLTERSVVDPGQSKLERFTRIAREAAKQSRSAAPMRISAPTPLVEAIRLLAASGEPAAVLTTKPSGTSLTKLRVLRVVVGPEGGWSPRELEEMETSGLTPARLTQTILRTETAAVCAAGLLAVRGAPLG